ncbi:hypothetical protein HK100_009988 [Physocladia obscura]|uniref:Protein kinase domain-containing protein n=1 Tax=Physocladia obscura TaxID=109957 RepID=A0AAD5T5K7_9FUNG|nr:hypothetical protein HK100_009988 [Physocladia obscura]
MIAENSFLSLFGLSSKQILGDNGSSTTSSNSTASSKSDNNNSAAKEASVDNLLNQTASANSNPVVKIIRPPRLAAYAAAAFTKLSAEKRARVAVTNAFKESFFKMTRQYQIFGIVGYGGNGVVLSAKERLPDGLSLSVAIKIIYRRTLTDSSDSEDPGSATDEHFPTEISALQSLNRVSKILRAIHRSGFYHGDVKVENILVEYPQTSGFKKNINGSNCPNVMLSDYGHTRAAEKGIKRYGTQEISPPEFIEGSPFLGSVCLDGRCSDVFALGMVAFVLLSDSGDIPDAYRFTERGFLNYQSLCVNGNECFPFNDKEIENMPDDALDLICRMCAMDPAKRPDLNQILSHRWLQ